MKTFSRKLEIIPENIGEGCIYYKFASASHDSFKGLDKVANNQIKETKSLFLQSLEKANARQKYKIDKSIMAKSRDLIFDLIAYCHSNGFSYRKPFVSFDPDDNCMIIEWHNTGKISVINVNKNENFYFIAHANSISKSLDGNFRKKIDFYNFCSNAF
ncbi:MAG: hypothetical protein SFT90_01560 [Rickettsiales bacterium]|nr:hypothetical protein [Rickettsiales bacterium]